MSSGKNDWMSLLLATLLSPDTGEPEGVQRFISPKECD